MHNHRFPGAVFALLLAGTITLTGCGTTGAYNAATVTNVELSEDNYEVVATNVRGSAQAGYILGASFAASRQQRTLALVRVAGSSELYGEALNNLWASFEAASPSVPTSSSSPTDRSVGRIAPHTPGRPSRETPSRRNLFSAGSSSPPSGFFRTVRGGPAARHPAPCEPASESCTCPPRGSSASRSRRSSSSRPLPCGPRLAPGIWLRRTC